MTIGIGNWQDAEFSQDEKDRSLGGQLIRLGRDDNTNNTNETPEEPDADADAAEEANTPIKITVGPIEGEKPDKAALRYPMDAYIDSRSDFVFFQFGQYLPPFSIAGSGGNGGDNTYLTYNASTNLKRDSRLSNIILPMPQDLGNDLQQGWAGKSFSALGKAAVQAVAGGNMAAMGKKLQDTEGNIKALTKALQVNLLNKLPGVGGNLTIGDVTGSTEGIVFNPNAELLYDQPELREIGMTFKLVPRNQPEAKRIHQIIKTFRLAAAPEWGGKNTFSEKTDLKKSKDGGLGAPKYDETLDVFGADNFMQVPNLCKFTFMRGERTKKQLIQFKPCAISRVAVNYTPDGTYATYSDGSPIAIELQLSFVETKVLFKKDIKDGF